MSDLPPLPSAMQNAPMAQNASGADAQVLTTPVSMALKLDGPGFKARTVISKTEAVKRDAYAKQLLRDPGFNALWLANYARNIQLDTAPLEKVLANTRALNAGEVATLTINAVKMMDGVNQHLPKPPNPKFLEAYKRGTAKASEILSVIKWLTDQIDRALRMYDSMLAPFTDIKGKLQNKYDLMVEAIVLNQVLAKNEDERTMEILKDTALLEFILVAFPDRLNELQAAEKTADDPEAAKKEVTRVAGLQPLVVKAVSTLNPMVVTGNVAEQRYFELSNMAGGRAVVLGLFLSAGIARWESDVVTELQEMNQMAVGLALDNVESFMNAQAARTSGGFVELAGQYKDLMNRWMIKAETMQKVVDDIAKAREILVQSAHELVTQSEQTASAVQDAKIRIDQGQAKFNDEMLKVAESAAK